VSFHHLDRWADVPSPVTRLAPTARLLGTVAVALGSALLPVGAWPQMAALLFLVLGFVAAARIPVSAFAARLAGPLFFVLLASCAVLILAPGESLWAFGPVRVTDTGLARFASVVGRATPALGAAVVLVSTLRFPELLEALRKLRLPSAVTAALGLSYRLLYTLADEIERLRRAARSRNAGHGAAGRRRTTMGIAAASLTRSFARSERVHRAMLARGYSGALPTLRAQPLDTRSVAALCGVGAVVLVVVSSAYL
jgi:cobalt/nickel transport system permease protein